jgi:hypothetical protein
MSRAGMSYRLLGEVEEEIQKDVDNGKQRF